MDDKMWPSELFVNVAIELNEDEVGDEHVDGVFGESIIKTQEGGTRYIVWH
jgi:hypothetical protein